MAQPILAAPQNASVRRSPRACRRPPGWGTGFSLGDAGHGVLRVRADLPGGLAALARLASGDPQVRVRLLTGSDWDPVNDAYGALPFIYGTLVSSLIALVMAVPLSVATAIYLTELAPRWLRQPVISLIEMLAAIPSVILGLWGIFVMVPWMRTYLFPGSKPRHLGWTSAFQGPTLWPQPARGGMIIAIMIIPIITSVSREILRSVPGSCSARRAYALGATRWEVTRIAVLQLREARIFGAVILGLGRALGETMAVTMVIGNKPADRRVAPAAGLYPGQRHRQ